MDNELKTNAVHLSQDEQFQIRKNIVRLHRQGKKPAEIAEILDVSGRHVYSTIKKYKEAGIVGIKSSKRGRRLGDKRSLTPEQEKEIRTAIIDKNPEQLRLKGCMWTKKNIAEFIKRKFGIDMPSSTLGYYLERWGFSIQRPIKRAYKQNPEQINHWLNEAYPIIKARAVAENAEIYWGDETGVQNTADYLRGYALIGQTPIVQVEAPKFKANMLSAIVNSIENGLFEFARKSTGSIELAAHPHECSEAERVRGCAGCFNRFRLKQLYIKPRQSSVHYLR